MDTDEKPHQIQISFLLVYISLWYMYNEKRLRYQLSKMCQYTLASSSKQREVDHSGSQVVVSERHQKYTYTDGYC